MMAEAHDDHRSNLSTTFAHSKKLVATSAGGVAILIGIAGLDQPIASWVHLHLAAERQIFAALTHIVDPLLPLGTLVLLAAGSALFSRLAPRPWARTLVVCALAVVLAVALKDQAKYLFGRLWPETWVDNNPSWIGTGAYGFHPFHGGRGWASFPSGHMTLVTAPATVLATIIPRLRWLAMLATGLVAVGLLGSNYHYLSDIIAGTMLGSACGFGALACVSLLWRFGSDQPVRG